MNRFPRSDERQAPLDSDLNSNNGNSNNGNGADRRLDPLDDQANQQNKLKSIGRTRTSRIITIAGVVSLIAIIATVLFTSERNGPGSRSLTTTTAPNAPTYSAANDSPTAPNAPSANTSNPNSSSNSATGAPNASTLSQANQPTAAPDQATNCVATETMPGGDNFYVPDAPMVENLGSGLVVQGTVREAGTCQPIRNARIQIWLTTARGGEGEPSNRGSVMTDQNGRYRLETSPVVSQFGQPHVHIGYDDGAYRPLFLRAVMESEDVSTFTVDFVLEPNS
jgi:hypothetical protein